MSYRGSAKRREYEKKYREDHKLALRERIRAWRLAHHDEILLKERAYRAAHKAVLNAKNARYLATNVGPIKYGITVEEFLDQKRPWHKSRAEYEHDAWLNPESR